MEMEQKGPVSVDISNAPSAIQQFAAAKHRIRVLQDELKMQSQLIKQLMPEILPVMANVSRFECCTSSPDEIERFGPSTAFRVVNSCRKESLSKKRLRSLLLTFFTGKFGAVQDPESIQEFTTEACNYVSDNLQSTTTQTVIPANRKRRRC